MVRTFLNTSSVRHNQYNFFPPSNSSPITLISWSRYLQPSLAELYEDCAKKQGFAPKSITLADGTKAYWIGSSTAEKVIIWCHGLPLCLFNPLKTPYQIRVEIPNPLPPSVPGGGYNLPASLGHLSFCADINTATGHDVAVLFLGYTLAPHAHYPQQLIQAVELLRYVVKDLNRKPQNIMIAGDSAGANLTLGVLSHLSHPHPSISPLELGAPLRGTVLLAPWTSFDTEGWESVKYNKNKDTVTPLVANRWSSNFLGGKPRDEYNEPMTAELEWWRGLKAEEVLIVAGGDEILLDSIKTFGGKVKVSHDFFTANLCNPIVFHPSIPRIQPLQFPAVHEARLCHGFAAQPLALQSSRSKP